MLMWITGVMNSLGYAGVAALMFLENLFPPIPSELIMPLAGFTSTQGKLSFVGVVIAGTLGSVLGSLPLYFVGKTLGEKRLTAWADKHGKWLALSGDDIKGAKSWFDRHGAKAVCGCRIVPGVRSLISLPAGFSSMPLPLFVLYSLPGAAVWTLLLAYLGRLAGRNYEIVGRYFGPAAYVVLGVMLAAFVWRAMKRRKGAA